MSMKHDLRLVVVPRYPIYGPGGQKQGENPGQTLRFNEGVLRVPHDGTMTLEDGRQIDAQTVRDFIERHRLLGDLFMGFWKVDPVAPPISEEEMEQVLDAALNGDADRLRLIVEQERAGWGREVLIRRAEAQIEKIDRIRAELEAEAKGK
jgi:hypothetical protein